MNLKKLLGYREELDENYDPYRLTRLVHKVARSWRDENKPFKQDAFHWGPLIYSCILCLYNFSGLMVAETVEDISEVINMAAVFMTACGRNFLLQFFMPEFHSLVTQTIELEKTGPINQLTPTEYQTISKWRFIHNTLDKIFLCGFLVGGAMYVIAPILMKQLPIHGYGTHDITSSKWFYTIYFMEAVGITLQTPPWISVDFYICSFLCQLCKQLDILYDIMQNLQDKDISYLREAIDRHNRILAYGKEVCDLVNYAFGIIHAPYAMFLIFGTIAMTQIDWTGNVGFASRNVITLVVCLMSLALMCFIGDLVQELSERLGNGIILDNFLDHSNERKFLKNLEFVYSRSCCSLKIKYSPTMIVNLPMFSVTINYIFSIYTFARTILA